MYTPVSLQELDNARQDVESLEKVINGNENEDVTTRLGETYPTLSKFINDSESLVQSSIDAVIDGSMITDELVSVGGGETQADKNAEFELDKLDTGITVTPQYLGAVARTQAQVNAETVSLLDFGAPYSTDSTTHLQKAIDYLSSIGGGVLTVPYHTGTLKLNGSITLKSNVLVKVDKNLVIDCNENTSAYQFNGLGGIGAEMAIAAKVTSGATTIKTRVPHGLAMGDDILLVSQRECAHDDAGKDWRLGETTGNTVSPFFAEPHSVRRVISTTEIEISGFVLFPDYNVNNNAETSVRARSSATIQKVNYVRNTGWVGGVFKKETGTLFNLEWVCDSSLDIIIKRGYGVGHECINKYGLRNNIKINVRRPDDWVLNTDHSAYNSIRDISSWYGDIDLEEVNGSQGIDQTFSLYCGLHSRYKVKHYNSHEDAMTTHGCTYGAYVDIYAYNCKIAAFRNRARFATGKVVAVNCGSVLRNSSYGITDTSFEVLGLNIQAVGIELKGGGVSSITPAKKNTKIYGSVIMSPTHTNPAVYIQENLDTTSPYEDSGIDLSGLRLTSYNTYALYIQSGINGVNLSGMSIEHHGSNSPIYFKENLGHIISNFNVNMVNGTGESKAVNLVSATSQQVEGYGSTGFVIDDKTVKVMRGVLFSPSDIKYVYNSNNLAMTFSGASGNTDAKNLVNSDFKNLDITVLSGVESQNRLVLRDGIAIGTKFSVFLKSADPSYGLTLYVTTSATPTLNILPSINADNNTFITGATNRYFTIHKVADGVYNVY